jgi:cell division protein FtsL
MVENRQEQQTRYQGVLDVMEGNFHRGFTAFLVAGFLYPKSGYTFYIYMIDLTQKEKKEIKANNSAEEKERYFSRQTKIILLPFVGTLLVLLFLCVLFNNNSFQFQSATSDTISQEIRTAQDCIDDLSYNMANTLKQNVDSGIVFSDAELAQQLNTYEKYKNECRKNLK